MGTNFYAVLPVKKRLSDTLRNIADKMDEDPLYVKDIDDDLYEFNKELKNQVIHLGKRSAGWVFDWDGNEMKYYKPILVDIQNFIKDNNAIIVDEYNRPYSYDDFFNDELEGVLYDTPELLNGERYWLKYPEHRTHYCNNHNNAVAMYKEFAKDNFIEPKYHDFITPEGLRFALFTDFS